MWPPLRVDVRLPRATPIDGRCLYVCSEMPFHNWIFKDRWWMTVCWLGDMDRRDYIGSEALWAFRHLGTVLYIRIVHFAYLWFPFIISFQTTLGPAIVSYHRQCTYFCHSHSLSLTWIILLPSKDDDTEDKSFVGHIQEHNTWGKTQNQWKKGTCTQNRWVRLRVRVRFNWPYKHIPLKHCNSTTFMFFGCTFSWKNNVKCEKLSLKVP